MKKEEIKIIKKFIRKQKIKVFISNLVFFIMVILIVGTIYGIAKEGMIKTSDYDQNTEKSNIEEKERSKEENKKRKIIIPAIDVPKTYMGYEVNSRLEIPKIKLDTNVLLKYSKKGLDICASKYFGPDANEVGNYCIAGHNKDNMFNHLIDLKIDDIMYLTDNKNGIVKYKVYDIYKVKPSNIKPLLQKTDGKREITLITCVNYSKNRLIVKAVESI